MKPYYLFFLLLLSALLTIAASPFKPMGQDDLMTLQRISELEKEVNLLRIQLVSCQEDKENLQKQLDFCQHKNSESTSKIKSSDAQTEMTPAKPVQIR